jgi:putative transposase
VGGVQRRARRTQAARAAGEPYLSDAAVSAALTAAKATPERAWLGEVSAVVLQQALADLNAAYRNFFASVTGKRKGPKVGPPRFRSRRDRRQAIRFTANARFRVLDNGRLRLPKIGDVEVRWSRDLPAVPSSVTVIKDAAGRFFASFVVTAQPGPLPEAAAAECGIDLGLGHFAVLDDGTKIAAPRLLRRAEKKLKRAQRDLSRENQAVTVEDLAVRGLARTRLAKSVHDAGWSAFTSMLEYKAKLYGRDFRRIGRFEPTSQVCSSCGVKDGPKPLSVRAWQCRECGAVHDRDVNAARNILALGRRERLNAREGQARPSLAVAQAVETGSRRGAA